MKASSVILLAIAVLGVGSAIWMGSQRSTALQQAAQAEVRLAAARSHIETLGTKAKDLDAAKTELAAKTKLATETERKLKESQTALADATRKSAGLEDQLAKKSQELTAAQTALSAAEKARDALQEAFKKHQQAVTAQIEALTRKLETATYQLVSEKNAHDRTKQVLQAARGSNPTDQPQGPGTTAGPASGQDAGQSPPSR